MHIADVLRHLVQHAPELSETNRAEAAAAVEEHFRPAEPAPAAPEPQQTLAQKITGG